MRRTRIGIAAILLGASLGGFLDAIVLREIVQWHSMLSNKLVDGGMEAMQASLRADGWFQLLLWALALAGVLSLWSGFRAPGRTPSARAFAGNLLIGGGVYPVAEGVVNHFILEWHHVKDLPLAQPLYDWLFLFGGIGFILIGLALRDAADPGPVRDRRTGYDRRSEPRLI